MLKNFLVVAANCAPVFVFWGCYRLGGLFHLALMLMLLPALAFMNYLCTAKNLSMVMLNLCFACSSVIGMLIFKQLWYTRVSADDMTLTVGDLMAYLAGAYALVLTVIFLICRLREGKDR